jgi:peptidoglycan-associated lipoprotein
MAQGPTVFAAVTLQTLEICEMKITRTCSLLACVGSLLLAACSSTPTVPPVSATAPAAVPAPASQAQPQPMPAATATAEPLPAYLDPDNPLSKNRSVFFDFDESVIKAEYNPLIAQHGNFLAANSSVAIKIEGNTDERGSAEYNLSLGQRRAEAVQRALKIYGVKDGQMEATSWGRERPKATGHDEADWAQNRRADLMYPAK